MKNKKGQNKQQKKLKIEKEIYRKGQMKHTKKPKL